MTVKDFRDMIDKQIITNRPKLSVSSLKTYCSCLFNIYKHTHKEDDEMNLDFFNDETKFEDYLKNKTSVSRKTSLSALFVLTGKNEYREQMLEDCKAVNNDYLQQTKTQKQTDNWATVQEIRDVYDKLYTDVKLMFAKKAVMQPNIVISYLLVALLGGVAGCPPRRSLEYSLMKIRNYCSTDNYYKAGKFYFNKYKTSSKYGLQTMEVPKDIDVIIKKWIKINNTDFLLFSNNENKLNSSQITRILNKCFGKNISTDMLRHIYLSNLYKDVPALTQMENTANEMGHSLTTALQYVKK